MAHMHTHNTHRNAHDILKGVLSRRFIREFMFYFQAYTDAAKTRTHTQGDFIQLANQTSAAKCCSTRLK